MKTDKILECYFSKNIPDIPTDHRNDIGIIRLTSNKFNKYILEDWIDREKFLSVNDTETYISFILENTYDMLTNPKCKEFLQLSEFGHAMRMILGDTNSEKLVLYSPFKSQFIEDNISEVFLGYNMEKISMYIGTKNNQASEFQADTYAFEDTSDIDNYLRIKHENLIEVLIPSYEFNMKEDRSDLEKLIEQVTFQRLRLEEPDIDYKDKYNLSVNTIPVPV